MPLYEQTSEADKYLQRVASLAPTTLRDRVNQYKVNRAVVLGLPMAMNSPQGRQLVGQANLKIRQKLQALGTDVKALLEANGRDKAFLENEVNLAITALGGASKITQTSEWNWVLPDLANGVFVLPSLPFDLDVQNPSGGPPIKVTVNIKVNEDGTGEPVFVNEDNDSGDPV